MTTKTKRPASRGKSVGKKPVFDTGRALDVASSSVFVLDQQLQIVFANRHALEGLQGLAASLLEATSLRPEQVVGSPFSSLLCDGTHKAVELTSMATRRWHAETKIGRDWVEWNAVAMPDADGAFAGAVVTWTVTTQRRQADVRADEFAKLVDGMSQQQAMIEFGLDGIVQNANPVFLETMGYTLAEVRGQHHRMFVPAEIAKSADYTAFWSKLARGEAESGEFQRVARGGRELWLRATYF
ncbi:MAG: PAS domain-containing protein, partial [Planctomycetota bacterium]